MKIFALETDIRKVQESFISANESMVLLLGFHGFLFFIRLLRALVLTVPFALIVVGAAYLEFPLLWIAVGVAVLWFVIVFLPLFTAWLDWRFDFLLVTTEKIVYVNQSSIFHVEVRQMNLDNVASVHSSTQFWNIFPFGVLCFDLKEGIGQRFCLGYIPHAHRAATIISDTLTLFQKRKSVGAVA